MNKWFKFSLMQNTIHNTKNMSQTISSLTSPKRIELPKSEIIHSLYVDNQCQMFLTDGRLVGTLVPDTEYFSIAFPWWLVDCGFYFICEEDFSVSYSQTTLPLQIMNSTQVQAPGILSIVGPNIPALRILDFEINIES